MLKGHVMVGESMNARFNADHANVGSTMVQVSFADRNGNSRTEHCAAAPGGSCMTGPVLAGARGKVKILVTTTGKGTLTSFVDGKARDSEEIEGTAEWDYTVVEAPDAEAPAAPMRRAK